MEITVRTADRVQQGVLDIPPEIQATTTVAELLTNMRKEFALPVSVDYFIRSERQGKQLDPTQTLQQAGLQEQEILEVTPILQAGL